MICAEFDTIYFGGENSEWNFIEYSGKDNFLHNTTLKSIIYQNTVYKTKTQIFVKHHILNLSIR